MVRRTKRKPPRKSAQTLAIPSADNAKWVGFGFLFAFILVSILCFMIFQAHIR